MTLTTKSGSVTVDPARIIAVWSESGEGPHIALKNPLEHISITKRDALDMIKQWDRWMDDQYKKYLKGEQS